MPGEGCTHVMCCFGASAEVGGAFAPTHLEAGRYDQMRVLIGGEFWEHICKVPFIIGVDNHLPISVFDV